MGGALTYRISISPYHCAHSTQRQGRGMTQREDTIQKPGGEPSPETTMLDPDLGLPVCRAVRKQIRVV